jgi:hypothetical protein
LAVAAGANVVANDWAELKAMCEAGGEYSGNAVALSELFDASEYAGQDQTLDAKGAGRIFYGRVVLARRWNSMAWSSRTAILSVWCVWLLASICATSYSIRAFLLEKN